MLTHTTSTLELQKLIQEKSVSPLEVAEYYLNQITRLNGQLGAFTLIADADCLKAARKAEQAVMNKSSDSLPPYTGIPIAIKALTPVHGWPSDKCSRAAKGKIELFSHDVVTALKRAGFILIGQTTSPELGSLPITESDLYGITRNPWCTSRSPGGSSGGAAAAVAAGMVPIAEGSDGGGSIRIPASCCGLVGLKPSRGRVQVGPILTNSEISMKGTLTKTVADTAAALDVIKSVDPAQWVLAPRGKKSFLQSLEEAPRKNLRIAFCVDSPLGGSVDDECVKAVSGAALLLEEAGHQVFEGAPDWGDVQQFVDDFLLYWATLMGELEVEDEALFEPHTRHLRERSRSASAIDFRRAMTRLQRTSRRIVESWKNFDLLITPTIASLPPEVGAIKENSESEPTAPIYRSYDMVPFTGWFNVTGQPAISLPVHLTAEGIPVGVQLVGAPWSDRELLQVSAWIESALGWPKWNEGYLNAKT